MTDILWTLISIQILMGGFDTIYHHESTERLAWRPSQAKELRLHAVRNLGYAAIFTVLGWTEPHGIAAVALLTLMAGELVITLWDFIEEDRTRTLPATERVTHTLLALNYGIILAILVPVLVHWADLPNLGVGAFHGAWSWLCAIASTAVAVWALRDFAAANRAKRLKPGDPARLAEALRERQSILVTGGTGFIGTRLIEALVAADHDVTVLTRSRERAKALPAPLRIVTSLDQIACDARIDAIVNLAGEPISNGLWTALKRRRILRSRLGVTRDILALVTRLERAPKVLVSGSAIGWYGLRGDEILDEAAEGTPCFSRQLCEAWEMAAKTVASQDVRVVLLRTGLVLGSEGGMLSRMLAPFEFGFGGRFGDGKHWMSWIHRDDLIRLIVHAIATPALVGAVNGTAPVPVRNAEFCSALGRALSRPTILPMPAFPLRLVLGAFADELLLGGQRVVPQAALGSGFKFLYPDIDAALCAIVGRETSTAGRPC